MSPQILIRFHNDSLTAPVELDTENAPNACDLLWRMLETPFVGQAVHAIYCRRRPILRKTCGESPAVRPR